MLTIGQAWPRAQDLGSAQGGLPLVFRRLHQRLGRIQPIGFPGMREHASQIGTGGNNPVRHVEQQGIVRFQPTAMIVAIQFDQDTGHHAGGLAHLRQGIGLFNAIEQQLHLGAGAAAKLHRAQGGGRRQADRIGDVAITVTGEIFRLGSGGHRDRAGFAGKGEPGDVDALGGFQMRAQHHAERLGVVGEPFNVAFQLSAIQQQRRSDEVPEGCCRLRHFFVYRHLPIFLVANRVTGLPAHTCAPPRPGPAAAP